MERATIFSGFGGQGLLFAGEVLAQAALLEGAEVSWMPSYGPEMRGGTASCTVIVADRAIGSPIADRVDHLVALNPPSLAKYEPLVVAGGLIVANTSLVEAVPRRDDVAILAIPCTALARERGDDRFASIVALGGLVAARPIVRVESVREALAEVLGTGRADLIAGELLAFDAGYDAALATTGPPGAPAGSTSPPAASVTAGRATTDPSRDADP